MVEILQRIVDTRGDGCPTGLCDRLYGAEDIDVDAVGNAFESWEHYSGNPSFPVPDPENPGDPKAAVLRYVASGADEMYAGPYGELRLKLAAYLLEALS